MCNDCTTLQADGLAPGDVGPESAPNGAPESDTTPASASLHPSHEHVITPAGGGEGGVSNPCLTNDEDIETQVEGRLGGVSLKEKHIIYKAS